MTFRFPPSLFKQLFSSYDLSKKDSILWGINNESVQGQSTALLGMLLLKKLVKYCFIDKIIYHKVIQINQNQKVMLVKFYVS